MMLYPPFLSTASSALDDTEKHPADLLTPAIRVIQLVEMPAPPPQRRLPPSSASASSSSSSEDSEEDEDELDSYCSSIATDDDDEDMMRDQEREVEKLKVTRILAWRAQFEDAPPSSPTIGLMPPPGMSRKRSASHSSSEGCSSAPSKRSRTTQRPTPTLASPRHPPSLSHAGTPPLECPAPLSPIPLFRLSPPSTTARSPSMTTGRLCAPHAIDASGAAVHGGCTLRTKEWWAKVATHGRRAARRWRTRSRRAGRSH
ncbi:hypothetical protein B0H17DRAFT_1330925, partial [Mycena rosella]